MPCYWGHDSVFSAAARKVMYYYSVLLVSPVELLTVIEGRSGQGATKLQVTAQAIHGRAPRDDVVVWSGQRREAGHERLWTLAST